MLCRFLSDYALGMDLTDTLVHTRRDGTKAVLVRAFSTPPSWYQGDNFEVVFTFRSVDSCEGKTLNRGGIYLAALVYPNTAFSSKNSSKPAAPHSRPLPDCL
jgi:hypothetical protein